MSGAANYGEVAPHPALRRHVECFWHAQGPCGPLRILPDGCVDFLFDVGSGAEDARLVGAMTRPFLAPATKGRDLVAVRFHPGGAHGFLHAPLHEFTDDAVELTLAGTHLADLARVGLGDTTPQDRIAAIERWLLGHLPAHADAVDRALAPLVTVGGRIDAAAAAAGSTRQHFARAVRARTGLPPKLLARIRRLRRALSDPVASPAVALAARHGYADQAHFARDVRELTGCCWRELSR